MTEPSLYSETRVFLSDIESSLPRAGRPPGFMMVFIRRSQSFVNASVGNSATARNRGCSQRISPISVSTFLQFGGLPGGGSLLDEAALDRVMRNLGVRFHQHLF